MSSGDFSVYSWRAWFDALTTSQLTGLRDAWERALPWTAGHENTALRWDISEADAELARRCEEGG